MGREADKVGSYVIDALMPLSDFERHIIEATMTARHGLDDASERLALCQYLDQMQVTKREHTVVGSYTYFRVPDSVAPLSFTRESDGTSVDAVYEGVRLSCGTQSSIGTKLFCKPPGHIRFLEMFVYDGEMPPFVALVPSRIKEFFHVKAPDEVSASIWVDPLTGAEIPPPPPSKR